MPKAANLPTRTKLTSPKPTPGRQETAGRRNASKRKPSPTAAGSAADPIWAVIEKHRKELAAYTIVADRPGDIPRGAEDLMHAAGHPLLSTRPTTLLGAIALLRYVRSQHDSNDRHDGAYPTSLPLKVDGEIWVYAFLENIADALAALCGQKAVAR
jgi:hypothetical protein